MKNNKNKKHNNVIIVVRGLLILSVVINLTGIIFILIRKHFELKPEVVSQISERAELIFWAMLTYGLTYLLNYFENKRIHVPVILESVLTIYIFGAIFVTSGFDLFDKFEWWDMFLHTCSGMLLAFIGFLAIYKINNKHSMDISPMLVAAFSFGFSLSLNVFFEIYEFFLDIIFGTQHQSWRQSPDIFELGKAYQGVGLQDTMTDLICDVTGALVMAVLCYFLYKKEKKRTLEIMKEMFPD